jgi:hypothetical protein
VTSGSDIVCWADEETPLEVAPLAMAGSAVEGSKIGGEPKVGVERRNLEFTHSGVGAASGVWSRIGCFFRGV